MEHWRVAQLGTMTTTQKPPSQLARIDHRCDYILRGSQDFLVEFKTGKLLSLVRWYGKVLVLVNVGRLLFEASCHVSSS